MLNFSHFGLLTGVIFLIECFCFSSAAYAQPRISAETSFLINQVESSLGVNADAVIDSRLPAMKMGSEYFVSVLATTNVRFDIQDILNYGAVLGTHRASIATLKVPFSALKRLSQYDGFDFFKIASKASANLERAVKDVRADSVHQGLDLPQAYTGKDVIIGITDWGFDYTQPMFYDTNLQQTRILAAWDQFKILGPSPEDYSYGTEYSGETELLNAESDTANIYSYATHGSHVAGIAGGSGAGTKYRGVAFDANYLLVTFLVDEGAVIDAFEWMFQKSLEEQKRLVINMSWGLYYMGTLDGNSLVSQAIDAYSELGVVFVTSGGNNGNADFHIRHSFQGDTMRSRIGFVPNNAVNFQDGQSITAWGEVGESFQITFDVLDNANQLLGGAAIFTTATSAAYTEDDLIIAGDTFHYDITIDAAHPLNDRPHARLRIDYPPASSKIILKSMATSGVVHYWNLLETTTGVGNTGWDFVSLGSGYTAGNRMYGVGEPACTKSLITVGSYQAGVFTNGAWLPFGISGFSSHGPTLDERVKPDVTAPGSSVVSSLSSFTDGSYTPVTTIQFNGRSYEFASFSGTSMASPVVTGIVALMLEANPDLSPQMVKDILQQTAREDQHTGVLAAEGDNQWGHGKVQAYFAVQRALELVGVEEGVGGNVDVLVYPNPTTGPVEVKSPFEFNEVHIFNLAGRFIGEQGVDGTGFNMHAYPSGTYVLLLNGIGVERLVKITKI